MDFPRLIEGLGIVFLGGCCLFALLIFWLSFSASLFPKGRHYTRTEEDVFDKAIKKHYSKKNKLS
jgi:hypothetical protein